MGSDTDSSANPNSFFIRALHFVRRRRRRFAAGAVIALLFTALTYSHLFGPTAYRAETEQFIVTPGTSVADVAYTLKDQGFVESRIVAHLVLSTHAGDKGIRPGGYDISQSMDLWMLTKTLTAMPRMVYVTIPSSVRKEQIGELLSRELFWGDAQRAEWEAATSGDIGDGMYYPDMYLIPSDQPPAVIAARFRGRFTDEFAPYAKKAEAKGLAWEDVLTLASLVDREASKIDRTLVAGILWNRLEIGMPLQVDATLQYITGEEGSWWVAPDPDAKYIDSPFNTYMYAGLPPHPINNPTMASVEAVLNPQETGCMYYLHDVNHQIHCALTYSGQKANIDRYLR